MVLYHAATTLMLAEAVTAMREALPRSATVPRRTPPATGPQLIEKIGKRKG